jgi:hypothetical protein
MQVLLQIKVVPQRKQSFSILQFEQELEHVVQCKFKLLMFI